MTWTLPFKLLFQNLTSDCVLLIKPSASNFPNGLGRATGVQKVHNEQSINSASITDDMSAERLK